MPKPSSKPSAKPSPKTSSKSPTDKPSIFISHAHRDYKLAEALHEALTVCLGEGVDVRRSSKKGEIAYGDSWIDWIHEQVQVCSYAIVLLTPTSFQAPWIFYESGGVDGVKRALSDGTDRRLVCLSFLGRDEPPAPFKSRQIVKGHDEAEVLEFLSQTISHFTNVLRPEIVRGSLIKLHQTTASFMKDARKAMLLAPVDKSEELIQEWCDRLDKLISENKPEQAAALRRMMGVAFFGDPDTSGTKAGPGERYIDLRLHRRFGEIFDSLGRYKDAIEEYRLAQCVAQRDVFLLHRLGLALVNDKQYKAAEQVLGDIDLIDPDIARESEEIANLRARFHSKQGQTDEAIGALRAFKHQSESYYVMNNLAIHDMMSEGRITESIRKVFESCREVAQRKAEDDFWARGTLINCLLALGEDAEAERHLNLLRREAGNLREFESATQNCKDILRLRPGGTRGFDLQEATGSGRVHHLKTAGS